MTKQTWCAVRFRQEGYKPRLCSFTYRATVNGVAGPLRCSNCGRCAPSDIDRRACS